MRSLIRALALVICCGFVMGAIAIAAVITLRYGNVTEGRGCYTGGECETRNFDAVEWATYGNLSMPIRLWMIDDLLQNTGVEGKSHEWVDANLGTPDTHEKLASLCDYIYWLGPKQALITVDEMYLCITFDHEVVSHAAMVEG